MGKPSLTPFLRCDNERPDPRLPLTLGFLRYGDAADQSAGAGAGAAPAFAPVAELYLSAPGSALHEGNADPVAHTVVQGETLQSIARTTLGDSRLWYRIAQANGLPCSPMRRCRPG